MEEGKFQELVLDHLNMLSKSVDILALNQKLMQDDIKSLKDDVSVLKDDGIKLRQGQARIEHSLSTKITALFDFRDNQTKTNMDFTARLEKLEAK